MAARELRRSAIYAPEVAGVKRRSNSPRIAPATSPLLARHTSGFGGCGIARSADPQADKAWVRMYPGATRVRRWPAAKELEPSWPERHIPQFRLPIGGAQLPPCRHLMKGCMHRQRGRYAESAAAAPSFSSLDLLHGLDGRAHLARLEFVDRLALLGRRHQRAANRRNIG